MEHDINEARDIINNISNNLISNVSNKVFELQNKFLNSYIGETVNNVVDIALKSVLPDAIEDQVVDIKNSFLENGISEGINTIVSTIKDYGKSALGIISGNFENVTQLKMSVKSGGVIPMVSKVLDSTINVVQEKGIISKGVAKSIKKIKNDLLKYVKNNLSDTLKEQEKYNSKLELYSNNWKEAYENRDFKAMEKAYKKLKEYMEKVMPTEEIYKEGQFIENVHNRIISKNEKMELSENELNLAASLY